jgi:subtilisin family serine protease
VISNLVSHAWRSGFLYSRLLLASGLCSAGLAAAFLALESEAALLPGTRPAKVAPWVLDHGQNGATTEFIVVLRDQADLRAAATLTTKHEKGRYVRDSLWRKAQTTQQPIVQWLKARGIEHRAFYIVNAIWVRADAATAAALAARPDVLRIEGNPVIRNVVPQPVQPAMSQPAAPQAAAAIEPGISYSRAPDVWAMGYTGQGIVIAGADTGYLWNHTALINKYRGWNTGTLTVSHDYNWHDSIHDAGVTNPCGSNSPQPCDDQGHGTHTMGTAVGDDGLGNQIGMAPGAKWIGCRNMDANNGTPARYIECMEFFLAPYPVNGSPAQGDSSKAPDISTNSWSCPASEGCTTPGALQSAVEAQRAAGIMMLAAAQNAGPNCSTVVDPPGIYDAVYSIGALNTGTDTIATFSSRGPVTVDQSNRLKPDLCAPGTSTRSAYNTSPASYTSLSGTSMATPHVAGAVALLWSAQPWLRHDIDRTEAILNETAAHISSASCSSPQTSPNNVYGFGRLDIKAAVDAALLRVLNIQSDGTAVNISFFGVQGRTYRLEHKSDLTLDPWQPIQSVSDLTVSTTGPANISDPGGGGDPLSFYRVRLLP